MRAIKNSFTDGVVRIYSISNNAEPGDIPQEETTLIKTLRYEERTVGITRFYAAQQANIRVDYVLRVPRLRDITTQDKAMPNDGLMYRIVQIQYPRDLPLVMDLTLEQEGV